MLWIAIKGMNYYQLPFLKEKTGQSRSKALTPVSQTVVVLDSLWS